MIAWEEIVLQLALVILVGGLIGLEREFRSKSAGFRTMILICLGSYLFTMISMTLSRSSDDRIASNIVTGIGFLGAGVIFRSQNRINGITTAATIWVSAALGMGIADRSYTLVGFATGVVLIILWLMTRLERLIDRVSQNHTYRIVSVYREDLLREYERMFDECGLTYKRIKRTKSGDHIIGIWHVHGTEKNHNRYTRMLIQHPAVKEFEF